MSNIAVKTTKLSKSFDPDQSVVHNLDLEVYTGEILALLGPSGCGKTTTLRLIAGFEQPDNGSISINERLIAGDGVFLPPEKRGVGMVFQDYALFPHISVAENVGYGVNGSVCIALPLKKTDWYPPPRSTRPTCFSSPSPRGV